MSKQELKPLVIIGGGGHASVLVDILRSQKRDILAVVCPDDISGRCVFSGIMHLKNDDDVLNFSTEDVLLVNGIGMLPKSHLKQDINEYFLSLGYEFETVIASSAQVSEFAQLGDGAQVFAGAIIQTGVKIGRHSIVNTGVVIEHDCCIGKYNHIAPAATLCGQVITDSSVYIGAGAVVFQNVQLGLSSIIGAGTLVSRNVPEYSLIFDKKLKMKKRLSNDK